uniref:Uncharacterized protein n=1 Tax=Lactuca sativa TaxID=4236 RepID=A0A9R1V2J8_LACSA|nr:hypothetical protein LSAT_V11C600333420 [Lactuca sativa]
MSTLGSSSNPSSNPSEAQSNTVPSAWRHITELRDGAGKKSYFCTFCKKTYNGGAKEKHAGVLGDTSGMNVHNLYDVDDDDDEVQVLTQQTTQKKDGKRKAPTSQTQTVPPFSKRGIHDVGEYLSPMWRVMRVWSRSQLLGVLSKF